MSTCPNCAEDNPGRARFCLACGTPLASAPPARETRKVVTVVFCDVTGSTAMGEELDPETLRRVMGRYFDEMRIVIERHGGVVEKFIGDAVMAVFGIPQLHEDDALRAVRAAAEMGERLETLNAELQRDRGVRIVVRTGVNTGEVVAGDPSTGQRLVTGDAVNVAARLEQAAPPGQILLGDTTHRLVRDAVSVEPVEPLSLKGKAEPVSAFRLLEVIEGAEAHARRFDSPMVGREREQQTLRQAFDRTMSERTCHLFTVLGAAGVGKSRLVYEFLDSTPQGTRILRGRCLSYGDGITFWPVGEVVREAAGIVDDDSQDSARAKLDALLAVADDGRLIGPRIAEIVGLSSADSTPEETFWAVRKLFEALAAERPLVVVFDDIHWGEPTFLDLIEHVADWSRDAPILLLCPARPEVLDRRPNWAGGKMNATSILLEPLQSADCVTLISNLLGATALSEGTRDRIVEAAEGNPLFVEEMLAMLIDDGLLRHEGDVWVPLDDLSEVLVPPTIHALLAARLDRLDPEERDVIERGAVEGKVFHRGAVAELSPDDARATVAPRLLTLTRKELIRPDRAEFAGEDAFRFRHQLIRDAAYQGMSKEARASLHERFADWLERAAGERVAEYEEILGYHLEQAYRYREELGPVDDSGRALATRAAARLGASGRRAVARGDAPAARRLLSRAAELVAFDEAARIQIAPDLGEALLDLGELQAANDVLVEAKAAAARVGDRQTGARVAFRLTMLETSLSTDMLEADAEAQIRQAISVLEESGDELEALEALSLLAFFRFTQGHAGEAMRIHDEVRAGARRLGHGRSALASRAYRLGIAYFGPTPAQEGVDMLRAEFEEAAGDRRLEGLAAQGVGGMLGYLGRFDEARSWAAEARSRFLDLGMPYAALARAATFAAPIEVLAGDLEQAEALIRPHYEFLVAAAEKGFMSTTAADLAEVMYGLGAPEEAERLAEVSRQAAGEDDVASQAEWRSVKAKVLADRGEHQEAERLSREAVAIMGRTDYLDYHGRFLLDLAHVLRAAGREGETEPILREALQLFEHKQNLVLAARTRSLLEDLGPNA